MKATAVRLTKMKMMLIILKDKQVKFPDSDKCALIIKEQFTNFVTVNICYSKRVEMLFVPF